jgi:hypothetical protein
VVPDNDRKRLDSSVDQRESKTATCRSGVAFDSSRCRASAEPLLHWSDLRGLSGRIATSRNNQGMSFIWVDAIALFMTPKSAPAKMKTNT